jgi:branched-chain amino acid transport system permease protein
MIEQPSTSRMPRSWLAVFALAMGLLPLLVRSNYLLTLMVFVGLYTILTVGLCLLMGYAGQVSLGHAAFYGLGAYVSAVTTVKVGLSPWLGILFSLIITGVIAFLIAQPIFRLRGHYLAMATLGFGYIVYIFFTEASTLTGGPSGLSGIPYLSIGGWAFDRDVKAYYLVWGVAILVLAASLNLVGSRTGRALRAIHGSEIAAQAVGVNARRLKTQVFVLSACFAGLAGSLYAHYLTFVNPSPFGFHFSVMLLVMASIGGVATVWGAPFGAAAVMAFSEILRAVVPRLLSHASGETEITVFGILLMLVMIFMPEGVVQRISNLYKLRQGGRRALPAWTSRVAARLRRRMKWGGRVEHIDTPG